MRRKLTFATIIFLIGASISSCSILNASAVKPESEMTKDKSNLEKWSKKVVSGLPGVIIKLAEKITKKLQTDIKLSEVIDSFNQYASPKFKVTGPLKNYLDRFTIQTPIIEYKKDGIIISGAILVNENQLTVSIEVGKEEDKWHAVFYIESPKKWKLSDYIPNLIELLKIDAKKLHPKLKQILEKPDIFEFEDSYLYISTTDIDDHEKLGDIKAGIGINAKMKLIGALGNMIDKAFVLEGEPVTIKGQLTPGIIGSNIFISLPANAILIPEAAVLKDIPNKSNVLSKFFKLGNAPIGVPVKFIPVADIPKYKRAKSIEVFPDVFVKAPFKIATFIPGFQLKLAPFEIKMVLQAGLPSISGSGGFMLNLPGVKETLALRAKLALNEQRITIDGSIDPKSEGVHDAKITDFLGIKGLNAEGIEIGTGWDLEIAAQIAEAGAAAFGVGALLGLIPTRVRFKGGLESGKSKMSIDAEGALSSTRGIILKYDSSGSLDMRDFMEFWLKFIAKKANPQTIKKIIEKTPPFVFENAHIKFMLSGDTPLEFNVGIDKFQLLPDMPVSFNFGASVSGISGSGSLPPMIIPNSKNPLMAITSSEDNKKGPSFKMNIGLVPPDVTMLVDGKMHVNLGKLGTPTLDVNIDMSAEGITAKSQTKLFGFDNIINISGSKSEDGIDPKSLQIEVDFTNKGLEEFTKKLKNIAIKFLQNVKERVEIEKSVSLARINASQEKTNRALDSEIKKTENAIKSLKKQLLDIYNKCKGKGILAPACYALEGTEYIRATKLLLEWHRDVTLPALKVGAKAVQKGSTFVVKIAGTILKTPSEVALFFDKQLKKLQDIFSVFKDKEFKITKFTFKAKLGDMLKKFPDVYIEGVAFGKPFKRTFADIDLTQPADIIDVIFTNEKPEIAEIEKLVEEPEPPVKTNGKITGKKPATGPFKMIEQMKKMQEDIRKKAEAAHQAAIKAAREAAAKKGARRVAAK